MEWNVTAKAWLKLGDSNSNRIMPVLTRCTINVATLYKLATFFHAFLGMMFAFGNLSLGFWNIGECCFWMDWFLCSDSLLWALKPTKMTNMFINSFNWTIQEEYDVTVWTKLSLCGIVAKWQGIGLVCQSSWVQSPSVPLVQWLKTCLILYLLITLL